ncbi:MAG: NADH-quinone oxidoreductase subunit L [Planctomycetota bacterium]|nr:MAG: NADH-quinone oxidoreductase subunit L [Planctomycetota bacterium]
MSLWYLPGLPLLGALACGLLYLLSLPRKRGGGHAHGHASGHEHEHASGHGHDDAHAHEPAADHAHDAHAPAPGASNPWFGFFALGPICFALGIAITYFVRLLALKDDARVIESAAWHWFDAGSFRADVSLVLDPLSCTLALVITGVGALIFFYALGYMSHDAGRVKFFAYLNLFVAAMLMLVLSSSLLGLFVGWEGVGLCSYLLIGFWHAKGWPAEAGQKAFVVNRIGDACFVLGSFLLLRLFGTLDLSDIGAAVHAKMAQPGAQLELALAGLLLFGGCCGKSAQFPLFTWLPDAMAGPTPVSALIHAATMVTAGVYLVARLSPLFAASPEVLDVIGIVGALTALIGASTGLVQRDIKRVLAYSTVSQLGYMFVGLGSGAFTAAVFHLVTHAFFKALLFLGAGSVIHGMHDEQDMHRMGGLRRAMPRTFVTFLCGAAALSGLPLLSGFFSKDEILAHAWQHGGVGLFTWVIGLAAAAMTAFYTWRMVALTFFGAPRYDERALHPHESPFSMTLPLTVLAVLAVVGGVLGLPPVITHALHVPHVLEHWLEPVFAPALQILHAGGAPAALSAPIEWALLALGAGIALLFAHAGFHAYKHGPELDGVFAARRPGLYAFLTEAWNVDRSYTSRIVIPVKLFAYFIALICDLLVIDGAVNGAGVLAAETARRSRKWVDGSVKSYSLWVGAGAALLALLWVFG